MELDLSKNVDENRESSKRKASEDAIDDSNNKKINLSISADEKLDKIIHSIAQLNNLYSNIKTDIDEIKTNQEFISNKFDEFNHKIEVITKDSKQMRKDIDSGKNIQNNHTLEIAQLQSELDILKQKEINNNVIISNLPNNIDPKDTVSKILNVLEATAVIDDIINIKLLPPKQNNKPENSSNVQQNNNNNNKNNRNNTCILVEFGNFEQKSDFINKKKAKKKFTHKRNWTQYFIRSNYIHS